MKNILVLQRCNCVCSLRSVAPITLKTISGSTRKLDFCWLHLVGNFSKLALLTHFLITWINRQSIVKRYKLRNTKVRLNWFCCNLESNNRTNLKFSRTSYINIFFFNVMICFQNILTLFKSVLDF